MGGGLDATVSPFENDHLPPPTSPHPRPAPHTPAGPVSGPANPDGRPCSDLLHVTLLLVGLKESFGLRNGQRGLFCFRKEEMEGNLHTRLEAKMEMAFGAGGSRTL